MSLNWELKITWDDIIIIILPSSHVTAKEDILLGSCLKCVYIFDLVAIFSGYIRIYTEFSVDFCCWFSVAFNWLLILSLSSGTLGFTGSDGATEVKRRTQRKTWPRTWTTPQPVPAWRRAACLRIVRAELDAPFWFQNMIALNIHVEAAIQLKKSCAGYFPDDHSPAPLWSVQDQMWCAGQDQSSYW